MSPTTYHITIDRYGTDFTQRASISTMINYVLNVAGWDAESKGFGVGELNENNHTWVLSRFAIELDRLPTAGEEISITTWISEYSRLVTTRCFTLTTQKGEKLAGAVSQWCMIDLKSRRAIDLSQLNSEYSDYVLRDIPLPISPPRRIMAINPMVTYTHTAAYSDIDFNGHVNSLRYIDLMLDALPLDSLKEKRPLRVDLQYVEECLHGDTLTINYEKREELSMIEISKDEGVAARCCIEWF